VDHLCHLIVRGARAVINAIEDLLDEIADDTLVQRGLEADLGLPQGSLDRNGAKPPPLTGVDEYIKAVDADAEKLAVAIESIKAYAKFWTDVFEAAEAEDPDVVASEALYRMFEWATVDLMKFEHPRFYAWMRLLRIFSFDVRTSFEETFAPEAAAGIFTGEYWRRSGRSYVNFRLDQAPDFVRSTRRSGLSDESSELRQLSDRVFGLSDATFGVGPILFIYFRTGTRGSTRSTAGRRRAAAAPPCLPPPSTTGIPLPDHREPRVHGEAPRSRARPDDHRDAHAAAARGPDGRSAGCSAPRRGRVRGEGARGAAGQDQGEGRGEGRPRRGAALSGMTASAQRHAVGRDVGRDGPAQPSTPGRRSHFPTRPARGSRSATSFKTEIKQGGFRSRPRRRRAPS
jgi:hypothetical protein